MSITDIYEEVLENLVLYNPVNEKVRYGKNADGGYVIIDGYDYDMFLSAGIADEISFENDFIKNNDIKTFTFDYSVKKPKDLHDKATHIEKYVGKENNEITSDLKEYTKGFNDIFIKMDIEGHEWDWIKAFDEEFHKVKQFVFKAHMIFMGAAEGNYKIHYCGSTPTPEEWLNKILDCLKILNKTHYLVHAHQNILGPFINYKDHSYPTFYDLTFLRKDCEIDGLNKNDLPISNIDFPCGSPKMPPDIQDKDMSFYPFKF